MGTQEIIDAALADIEREKREKKLGQQQKGSAGRICAASNRCCAQLGLHSLAELFLYFLVELQAVVSLLCAYVPVTSLLILSES